MAEPVALTVVPLLPGSEVQLAAAVLLITVPGATALVSVALKVTVITQPGATSEKLKSSVSPTVLSVVTRPVHAAFGAILRPASPTRPAGKVSNNRAS